MTIIANIIYILAGLLLSPMVLYRIIRRKRYRSGWGQRFGRLIRRFPDKKCIWIHAVSVGEINAAKTIIAELGKKFENFEIVISTTTDTGFERATKLYADDFEVFYFPFDLSWVVRRAFDRLRPSFCILMELEVWPNFTKIARGRDISIAIVNGRLSTKSFRGYKKIKFITRRIFERITLVCAQTSEYAQRFEKLGCDNEKVVVTGSLKYDTAQITDKVDGADQLARQLNLQGKLWVAGATGPGEENIILETYKELQQQNELADVRLAIVPRKPERFDEVASQIKQNNFALVRYSQLKENPDAIIEDSTAVILGDTMGDLRKFYSLATAAFVGRSLVPMGGSDMVEAAALGKCTIFGPYAFNFNHSVDALIADHGAIMVNDKDELFEAVHKCLTDDNFARQLAANGQNVIRENQGATKKSIEAIVEILM